MRRLIQQSLWVLLAACVAASWGCGVYTPYGAQTAGAKTFSVDYFTPIAPLAGPEVGQKFTEALKDLIQRQSTLRWVTEGLKYSFAQPFVLKYARNA